jgi:hypothetical protein
VHLPVFEPGALRTDVTSLSGISGAVHGTVSNVILIRFSQVFVRFHVNIQTCKNSDIKRNGIKDACREKQDKRCL